MKKHKLDLKKDAKQIANFLFEMGVLAKTPRSGFHFLGTGEQSVAEHLNRVGYIGFMLCLMDGKADMLKVLSMCMFHDIAEARISDLNYIHQKYVERKEKEAVKDLTDTTPFGAKILEIVDEYEERKSRESIIVKDADNLEWILSLKEEVDTGNTRALSWIKPAIKRLKTENAKEIAESIISTDSNDWWFDKKAQKSKWWVTRNKK